MGVVRYRNSMEAKIGIERLKKKSDISKDRGDQSLLLVCWYRNDYSINATTRWVGYTIPHLPNEYTHTLLEQINTKTQEPK